MSHIYEALKKLDRETSSRRFGWGPIGKEILKPGPPRPRKRIASYLIPVLLTAVATAAVTYGVTLTSDFLWKSKLPTPGISSAPSSQVAQISPGEAEAAKTLPPSPNSQIAKIPPGEGGATKISPPEPAKSPAPIQKPTPPSPAAGSLQKSSPSIPPRFGVPNLKSAPPPLVSGSSPKVPPFPPVQPPAPEGEDPETPPQTTRPDTPAYIPPQWREEIERNRQQRREAYRRVRERPQGNSQLEMKSPFPPATEGIPSPGFLPRAAEVLPGASPQAAGPSPNTSAGGPPRLKISGIVWHEQPAMRRAVINGSFATEGSQIEGVKVVEILPTRVRFSYKNQVFELSAFE